MTLKLVQDFPSPPRKKKQPKLLQISVNNVDMTDMFDLCIEIDYTIPENEIWIKDWKGNLVGKIVNIGEEE